MTIRENEMDEKFKKLLQNPPKPDSKITHSVEFEDYLKNLNDPLAKIKKEAELKKEEEEYEFHCPYCRRPSLRRTAQLTYQCFHCGLTTNSPLKMKKD